MAFSGDQNLHFSKFCEKLGSWTLDFAKKAFRMHSSTKLRSTIQIQDPKRLLESKGVGFKIQDSRFKAQTRRRMARERRGAESVSMETLYYKTIY